MGLSNTNSNSINPAMPSLATISRRKLSDLMGSDDMDDLIATTHRVCVDAPLVKPDEKRTFEPLIPSVAAPDSPLFSDEFGAVRATGRSIVDEIMQEYMIEQATKKQTPTLPSSAAQMLDESYQKAKRKLPFSVDSMFQRPYFDGKNEGVGFYLQSEGEVPAFAEFKDCFKIIGGRSENALIAMLEAAERKYGVFEVKGTPEFKAHCATLAAEYGFKIANPELKLVIMDKMKELGKLPDESTCTTQTDEVPSPAP